MTASVLALSNLTWGKSFLPRDLSHGRVIMVLRRIFLVLLLRQVAMGRIQYSSTYCQMCVGSCGYVPLCQVLKAAASRGLGVGNAYPFVGSPRVCSTGDPGSCHGSMREVGWAIKWRNPRCPL
jgi:hypothetical protein